MTFFAGIQQIKNHINYNYLDRIMCTEIQANTFLVIKHLLIVYLRYMKNISNFAMLELISVCNIYKERNMNYIYNVLNHFNLSIIELSCRVLIRNFKNVKKEYICARVNFMSMSSSGLGIPHLFYFGMQFSIAS